MGIAFIHFIDSLVSKAASFQKDIATTTAESSRRAFNHLESSQLVKSVIGYDNFLPAYLQFKLNQTLLVVERTVRC